MRFTTTIVAVVATISAVVPTTFSVSVSPKNTQTYTFEVGGTQTPSYCEPPRSGPGNNLPEYAYLDLSTRT